VLATSLSQFAHGLFIVALMAITLIGAAAGFWAAFQRSEPLLAATGACTFTGAGVVLIVAVGCGRALYSLADQWRVSGSAYDATWQAARAIALLFEASLFGGFGLLLIGLLAIGLLVLRRRVLPRWLGALATVAGGCVAVAFALTWSNGDLAYGVAMNGMLIGLIWFAAAGIWLIVRGTAERPGIVPGQVG
jgi:hypothetical protein